MLGLRPRADPLPAAPAAAAACGFAIPDATAPAAPIPINLNNSRRVKAVPVIVMRVFLVSNLRRHSTPVSRTASIIALP